MSRVRANLELDKLDLKIIRSLSNNARKSVTQLAKEVGVSRQTVIKRLKNLMRRKIIQFDVNIDLEKLGFLFSVVGLKVKDTKAELELRRVLPRCPRVLMLTCPLENATFSIFLFGEDMETMRSVIESLQVFPDVEVVYMFNSESPILKKGFKLKLYPEKDSVAPCGRKCSECFHYQNKLCVGCPAVTEYKGPL